MLIVCDTHANSVCKQ